MTAEETLARVVREEWGRLVALLLARFRRLDLVEDALADAVEAAARRWPADGVPDNPAGWLMTTARRRVLDRLRSEAMAQRRYAVLVTDVESRAPAPGAAGAGAMADPGGLVEDDLLRLVLMCTHPVLAPEAASALALRLVLGVSTPDIAALFLVQESTMAARITRAKKKIVAAGVPFAMPGADVLPERLETVAQTAYLAFTAGYAPVSGPDPVRAELAGEAVRLTRTVLGLRRSDPTLTALLALMLLQHSRRDARAVGGELVLLPDQHRSRWHHDEIAEAVALLGSPQLAGAVPARAAAYLMQARIAAEHATATSAAEVRWERIVAAYDVLVQLDPSPAARLARAVAVSEASGPRAGLEALEEVDIPGSHRVPSVRAELLARAGETEAAIGQFDEAVRLCRNESEINHLARRRAEVASDIIEP